MAEVDSVSHLLIADSAMIIQLFRAEKKFYRPAAESKAID